MTLLERVADWLTDGALTRARDERDSARRTNRFLTGRVGADIPIEDHVDAVHLLGAILARFTDAGTRAPTAQAQVGTSVLQRWRDQHEHLRARVAGDRRDHDAAVRQRQGASS